MAANWFEIRTTRGMLDKARRELRRFSTATNLDDYLDAAMNCSVAIWHVNDWLYTEARTKLAPLCDFKNDEKGDPYRFRNWLKEQNESAPIFICCDLTNGSKHMEITRYPDVLVRGSYNSAVGQTTGATLPASPDAMGSATFNVVDDDPPHVVEGCVLKIDFRDGRPPERAQAILRSAIAGWDAILSRHGLP